MAFLFRRFLINENSYEYIHQDKFEVCPICERKVLLSKIELHHTPPKSKGGNHQKTLRICGSCHDVLHYYVPLEEVYKYNTADKIKNIESMQKYLAWIQTKKNGTVYKLKKILKQIKDFLQK